MSFRNYRFAHPRRSLFLIALLVFVVSIGLLPIRTIAAQADPINIIDAAYQQLSAKLGKSVVRGAQSTYSWSFQTYTDTSLGCPQPGQSYAQQKIQAYDIQILYGATTYDFRANLDGSGLILCQAGSSTAPSNPTGAVLAVGGKAQVASGTTLVSDPTSATVVGQLNKGDVVDIVGGPTDNGGIRWWQVKNASGVTGWSPESGGTDVGIVVVLNPISSSTAPTATLAGVAPTPVPAPASGTALGPSALSSALAFIGPDGNVGVLNPGQTSALVTGDANGKVSIAPIYYSFSKQYTDLRWSPDGTKLAYTEGPAADGNDIIYMVAAGQAPVVIARNASAGFPAAWSPDGTKLAYAVLTTQQQAYSGGAGLVVQVQSVTITGTTISAPQYAGTFVKGVYCGSIDESYDANRYYLDVGFNNEISLYWTNKGFIHSLTCDAHGLALTDFSGKDLWTVAGAGRLAASKDLSRGVAPLMAGDGKSLLSIDLDSGASTTIPVSQVVDEVGISPDGKTALFSSRSNQRMVQGNAGSTVGQQVFGPPWPIRPAGAVIYTDTLSAVPTSGGTPVQLFQADGYSVGVITVSPDNATVVFSFISALGTTINLVNQGAPADQVIAQIPKVALYSVPINASTPPTPLGVAGHPAFGQGAFQVAAAQVSAPVSTVIQAAPTTLPNSSGVTPPALVVGGHAVVSTTGTTLNVRKSASRTAEVVRLLNPGAVVTIMSGPVSAEGFRWWQISTDDGSTGWVVDQFTDQDGTANTLTPQ